MKIAPIFAALVLLASCTQPTAKAPETDSTATTIINDDSVSTAPTSVKQTLCFQNLFGKANQDTTSITLNIDGSMVTGTYNWIPSGKDARKGTLSGTYDGTTIDASWKFMQEGMTDSIPAVFKLEGDRLLQKPYSYDPKTGREQIADNAPFSVKYLKVDCR